MRGMILAVLALLSAMMLPSLHAQAVPQSAAAYLEPGMNAAAAQLQSDGLQLVLVSIDGQEAFLVEDNKIITSSSEIQSRLERHLVLASTFYPTLNESLAMLDRLQTLRIKPEAKCALVTGLDSAEYHCVDKDSCLKAAQTNPSSKLRYFAEGFWEAMLDWQSDRSTFNSSLSNTNSVLTTALPTADSATRASGSMTAVRSAFDQFMHNDLYRTRWDEDCTKFNRSHCFEFCTRTNWTEYDSWSAMAGRWTQISANLAAVSQQAARAQAIASITNDWLNYSKNKQALWSAMSSELDGRQTQLASQLGRPNKTWADDSLSASFLDWQSQYNQAQTMAKEGRMRAALGQKPAMLKSADELSLRISKNDERVKSIQNSMTSIQLALGALGAGGSAKAAELSAAFIALQTASAQPISADKLETLQKQASDLELLTLAESARAQLGAPPSSSNVSAQAAAISPAAAAQVLNATTQAKEAGSTTNPFGLPCALPLAVMVFMLAISLANYGQRKH